MKKQKINLGDLVRCIWLDGDSFGMTINHEQRAFYTIYLVYDFYANDYYWVDEEDLEKL